MATRQRLYLVAYDIADPKRLNRVHRVLKKEGLPLQYSVFSVSLNRTRLNRLLLVLDRIIDAREDDIRCYALSPPFDCQILGKQYFPEEVMLFSGGVELLLG